MNTEQRQIVYLAAAVVGLLVTWYWNLEFMQDYGGFTVAQFVADNYVNAASASISNDLLTVVFTFLFWSWFEARRHGMRHWWLYPVLTFTVAIAVALPLFLLFRERRLAVAQPA